MGLSSSKKKSENDKRRDSDSSSDSQSPKARGGRPAGRPGRTDQRGDKKGEQSDSDNEQKPVNNTPRKGTYNMYVRGRKADRQTVARKGKPQTPRSRSISKSPSRSKSRSVSRSRSRSNSKSNSKSRSRSRSKSRSKSRSRSRSKSRSRSRSASEEERDRSNSRDRRGPYGKTQSDKRADGRDTYRGGYQTHRSQPTRANRETAGDRDYRGQDTSDSTDRSTDYGDSARESRLDTDRTLDTEDDTQDTYRDYDYDNQRTARYNENKDGKKRKKKNTYDNRHVQREDGEDTDDWKGYHRDMNCKISLERLRDSMATRDVDAIHKALEGCKASGLAPYQPDVEKGKRLLQALLMKKDLNVALEANDVAAISAMIQDIKASGCLGDLQTEVREAQHELDSLLRLAKLNTTVLNMDKRTMSEVRRYHKPPPVIHHVMQAALLLLGEDEGTTQEWKECQRICNPQLGPGRGGLSKRLLSLDVDTIHPEIAARAKQILSKYDLKHVQTVSAGAGTFYVWTMGVIEEVDNQDSEGQQSGKGQGVRPANIMRQREILNKPVQLKGAARFWATQHGQASKPAGPESASELTPTEYVRSPRNNNDRYY